MAVLCRIRGGSLTNVQDTSYVLPPLQLPPATDGGDGNGGNGGGNGGGGGAGNSASSMPTQSARLHALATSEVVSAKVMVISRGAYCRSQNW